MSIQKDCLLDLDRLCKVTFSSSVCTTRGLSRQTPCAVISVKLIFSFPNRLQTIAASSADSLSGLSYRLGRLFSVANNLTIGLYCCTGHDAKADESPYVVGPPFAFDWLHKCFLDTKTRTSDELFAAMMLHGKCLSELIPGSCALGSSSRQYCCWVPQKFRELLDLVVKLRRSCIFLPPVTEPVF